MQVKLLFVMPSILSESLSLSLSYTILIQLPYLGKAVEDGRLSGPLPHIGSPGGVPAPSFYLAPLQPIQPFESELMAGDFLSPLLSLSFSASSPNFQINKSLNKLLGRHFESVCECPGSHPGSISETSFLLMHTLGGTR